jgi:hypothetical protein
MQQLNKPTRRRMLSMSLALAGYAFSTPLRSLLAQQQLRRTPDQILRNYSLPNSWRRPKTVSLLTVASPSHP